MNGLSKMGAGSRVLTLLCLSLCFVASAIAQTDLSGYWDVRVPNAGADGTFRDTYFEIHQTGDTLTGFLIRHPNGIPITGTFQNGIVHFSTVSPNTATGHPARSMEYDGSFEGGKLVLQTSRTDGARTSAVGERVTREATLPPAALPLPALEDLPDNGLARTPPMGWNSWNKFAGKVDDAAVRGMADAMVASGMKQAGYTYINIDDTWELGRDAQGNITTNKKFPDMKALADYVHSKGLKIGIYSSPGPQTCARYEGSFGHEVQDAKTYAAWGMDYLKYDLCSAREIYKSDAPTLQAIYQKMGEALAATHRPIVYSLCEYGVAGVWTGWGEKSGGNLWRTTGDIQDKWQSMDHIGFSQIAIAKFAKPGHWNDPDMLEIGNGGMTADEYRTHMSLWSMLAAPLIAGNDLRSMTDETRSILMNTEVIAIDQDPEYKPVASLSSRAGVEVLLRPLHDGSVAIGMFNRTAAPAEAGFARSSLPPSLRGKGVKGRDLWKHQAVSLGAEDFKATVPSHGVVLLRIGER